MAAVDAPQTMHLARAQVFDIEHNAVDPGVEVRRVLMVEHRGGLEEGDGLGQGAQRLGVSLPAERGRADHQQVQEQRFGAGQAAALICRDATARPMGGSITLDPAQEQHQLVGHGRHGAATQLLQVGHNDDVLRQHPAAAEHLVQLQGEMGERGVDHTRSRPAITGFTAGLLQPDVCLTAWMLRGVTPGGHR